jgi:hypothetical protein
MGFSGEFGTKESSLAPEFGTTSPAYKMGAALDRMTRQVVEENVRLSMTRMGVNSLPIGCNDPEKRLGCRR